MATDGRARSTNEIKFETGNPVVQRMIGGFLRSPPRADRAAEEPARGFLDAGCGEGETIARLDGLLGDRIAAVDISTYCVDRVSARHPQVDVFPASVTELPFADDGFDLVLCLEVLEHLAEPRLALPELGRVGTRDLVISVPDEPWFRIGSCSVESTSGAWATTPSTSTTGIAGACGATGAGARGIEEIRVVVPWLIARGRV